jgi:hypothetical protein
MLAKDNSKPSFESCPQKKGMLIATLRGNGLTLVQVELLGGLFAL